MDIHLRFGMHRDIQVIHEEKDNINGLVIPGNILAHQAASTSVFVASMPDKPYIIDPMTCVLQQPADELVNDEGCLRVSVAKTCAAYHRDLADKLLDDDRLTPQSFPDCREFCENVLAFQREHVAEASSTSAASKYLKRYRPSQISVTRPRLFLPPYFCFDAVGDNWYKLSHRCAKEFAKLTDDVAAVICCSLPALTAEGVRQIVRDFSDIKNIIIWIDDYLETGVSAEQIRQVRGLICALKNGDHEIETLYGGYLMILSWFDGLSAISHGILYTQHKATTSTPGSGGAPERYYIPQIHQFRSLSQTDLILHKHPELICHCPVCEENIGDDPDNIVVYRDEPDLLRRHFLSARRQEADEVDGASSHKLVAEFRRLFEKYHASFRSLPNPDAFVQSTPMQGLAYLRNWADAFDDASG